MDFWLRLGTAPSSAPPRNLSIIVTVFKKNCNARDPNYRHCRHTDYCVRNEYFCDSHANCAWPSGDSASDEEYCKDGVWAPSDYRGSDSPLSPSNIPIIIIVIIVVIGVVIVFSVALSHFIKTFKSSGGSDTSADGNTQQQQQRNRRPRPPEVEVSAPMLLPESSTGGGSPSAPPSYEEAVKTQPPPAAVVQVEAASEQLPASPPPYSAQAETRTGFI